MKITYKGMITELGSNYTSNDTPHSGMIIQVMGQNLHFELAPDDAKLAAQHLFDHVIITIRTETNAAFRGLKKKRK